MNPPLILPHKGEFLTQMTAPRIAASAFIAPGAAVIGDVEIGEESSVWFGCVVRGDVNTIRIGSRTNIQDSSTVHVTRFSGPTIIGSGVTIGHAVLLHACEIKDNAFIGMRATLMDDVIVEEGGWVAAGALVTPGKRIPSGQIWAGSPAKYFRDLTEEERAHIPVSAENYVRLAGEYL